MSRVRRIAGRVRRTLRRVPADQRCRVCRSVDLIHRDLAFVQNPERTCQIKRCRDCGYVAILRSEESLWKQRSTLETHESPRVGTQERVGREFHMGKMAVDMLGRKDLSVLVYGAGAGLDNLHIERLDEVAKVSVGDIMKLRDDADFVDLTKPAEKKFDLVIASEVIEHFRAPRKDFERLFGFVKDDGLIVAATNIHAGNDLAKDGYIFFPDHTSYYSPRSLRLIANDAGFHLDFRAPLIGPRMRKRYIFFSRSRSVMEDVACYFGTEVYAPSEVARAIRPPPQRSHAAWRPTPEGA
ncbi:MAG: class I SAM-dependent methyltransferase [Marmoricola sp.]